MKISRYFLVALLVSSLFAYVAYAQTDVPYINPPVTYDYSGDSDSTSDAVTQFTPDSEAIYIKVIGFNPSGTETHLIEVWSPAGELYFSEGFGAGGSGWSGDWGDYMIESRPEMKFLLDADRGLHYEAVAITSSPDSGVVGTVRLLVNLNVTANSPVFGSGTNATLNKSFLGGRGGQFFKKAPLAGGGVFFLNGDRFFRLR